MQLRPASPEFAEALASAVPAAALRRHSARYSQDPRGRVRGQEGLVAAPATVDETAAIVKLCCEWAVPVVPIGGGTGLVGGHLPGRLPRPVILSMERMNRIRRLNASRSVITVEAGCILENVREAAARHGRLFPLSLAAKGSCQIGGNLATNAGGANVIRYGNMRDLCLGIEAVLADGRVWNGLSELRKDNQGLDLRNLLIGSEGTLGVITAANLKLFPQHAERVAALAHIGAPADALELLGLVQDRFGHMLTAFELMSRTGFEFIAETMPEFPMPFSAPHEWATLIEVGSECAFGLHDHVIDLLGAAEEKSLIADALVADSEGRIQRFWELRERIPEANRLVGSVSSHDISVPIESIAAFIREASREVAAAGPFRINCFGHMGDGNLHFNVFPPAGRSREHFSAHRHTVLEAVNACVRRFGGSTSAEHGTGRVKAAELSRFGDSVYMDALRSIKCALDPANIMNPGAVFEWKPDR